MHRAGGACVCRATPKGVVAPHCCTRTEHEIRFRTRPTDDAMYVCVCLCVHAWAARQLFSRRTCYVSNKSQHVFARAIPRLIWSGVYAFKHIHVHSLRHRTQPHLCCARAYVAAFTGGFLHNRVCVLSTPVYAGIVMVIMRTQAYVAVQSERK